MGLHNWIQSFFTMNCRVKVGEECFKCIDVTIGVKLGSVLGPVLFFLYIKGYLSGLSCDVVMFAASSPPLQPVTDAVIA